MTDVFIETPYKSKADTLNVEQRTALEAILAGESIFLTGPGGSGKSYLLDVLQQEFKQLGKTIAITALTGCAALLLGPHAKTVHSWAGVGLGNGSVNEIVNSIVMNGRKKKNWKVDCLVIDEVSMLTPQLLELLDEVGRRVRKGNYTKPFGGLQLVFVGDFYQLPPICNGNQCFAFQSKVWSQVVSKTVSLSMIYRQSDTTFQKILNEARTGNLSEESLNVLKSRMNLPWKKLPVRPTLLFTRNADVSAINKSHFDKLEGETVIFQVNMHNEAEGGTLDGWVQKKAKKVAPVESLFAGWSEKDAPYDSVVSLKVGAQVMLTVNLDQEAGRINGSRGVITEFVDGIPCVQFVGCNYSVKIRRHTWKMEDGTIREQIPLKLAYALTIHKAQGASLDSAFVDIGSSTFEYGQAYVALSRVRSLEALFVYDVDSSAFKVNPIVKEFYES